METPARFDLNGAIHRWRRSLEQSSSLRGQDLEELESHLRDSWRALVERGLGSRDAFLIAVHRLGARAELEAEFAKVNVQQVWSERAVWILCGLLAANMLWAIISFPTNALLNLGLWHGVNAHVIGGLAFLTKWLSAGALVTLGFLGLTRFSGPLSRAAQVCLQRPVWTGIVLVLALEGIQLLPRQAMRLLEPLWQALADPGRIVPQASHEIIQRWFFWEWIATQLCLIASVPLFASYLTKRTAHPRLPKPTNAIGDFEPTEQPAISDLQRQGLSVQEAVMLLHSQRKTVDILPGENETSSRSLWLERGFWMLFGAVSGRLFVPFVLEPSTILLSASNASSSLTQHLAGFGSMCLCLGAIAGILVGVSKGITRYQHLLKWAGRLCCDRPVLAVVLSVVLVFGVGASLSLVERMILPGQQGVGAIGSGWLLYCAMASQLIVPVTLLVWLARGRYTKMRKGV